MKLTAKRYRVPLYVVFACVWFWGGIALGRLPRFRFWPLILGALAPLIAATTLTAWLDGEAALRELLRRARRWRVSWRWYAVVFLVPVGEALVAYAIASSFGLFKLSRIDLPFVRATLPGLWLVLLFALTEELGWRGYALDQLLHRYQGLAAAIVVGFLHAVWHWPLILIPGQYLSDVPLLWHTTFVISDGVVITWVYRNTKGSVLMAALFHAMSNIAHTLYLGVDPLWMPRMKASISVLTAFIVVLIAGKELVRTRLLRTAASA